MSIQTGIAGLLRRTKVNMNVFSKQLSFFVAKKGANISQMASYCSIDRSTMYKIINGTRKPSSEILVKDICGFLKLSPEESSLLMENYRITEIGIDNYRRRKNTLSFLKACLKTPPVPSAPELETTVFSLRENDSSPVALSGTGRILNACGYILQQEMKKENGFLHIRLQPKEQFTNLLRILCAGINCADSFQIQHVIALDKGPDSDKSAVNNLNLISSLIPLFKQLPNYQLYYYYSGNREENPDYSFFPCIVLTGSYALQFSDDLQYGILLCHAESVALIDKIFSNLINSCMQMTKETFDYRNVLIDREKRYSSHSAVLIHPFPCMNFLLAKELLSKYVKKDLPERDFFINLSLELKERNRIYFSSRSITVLASEKGIRTYLNNGIFPQFLSDMFVPFERNDRVSLICRFRDTVKKYGISFRLITESFGELSSSSFIWIKDSCASFLFANSCGTFSSLFLREPDIIACFIDFFSNMPDHLYYSEQRSIEILDRILDEI